MSQGPVELTGMAHGGYAVGRLDGRVVFVRGGIPGEVVEVAITDRTKKSFWHGEVKRVVEGSPHRVDAPCEVANACGGCDFQHVALAHQRELKRQVVAEQLSRLAGITWTGSVEGVDPTGLGWRTRMRYHNSDGGFGLRAPRSHAVVPLPEGGCLIAHPAGRDAVSGTGDTCTVTVADSGLAVNGVPAVVTQRVKDMEFAVDADGFWQVHPQAAETLSAAVIELLEPKPQESALDLYCGVGLFAGFLETAGARVVGVEANRAALVHARRNVPAAKFLAGDTAKVLRDRKLSADIVVLDPPRSGAGKQVVSQIAALAPRAIAYVACDPAAFARDVAWFAERGFRLDEVRAYDLFPMTHHVECVGLLVPGR